MLKSSTEKISSRKQSLFSPQSLGHYILFFDNVQHLREVIAQKETAQLVGKWIKDSSALQALTKSEKTHLLISLLNEHYYISKFNEHNFTTLGELQKHLDNPQLAQMVKETHRLPYRDKNFNSYTNLVKAFTILSLEQIADYLEFIRQRTFPICIEDFLTSDVFFMLYLQIPREKRFEFMNETLLMTKWFLYSDNRLQAQDLSKTEKALFQKIKVVRTILPRLRVAFFTNNNQAKPKNLEVLLAKRYTLEFFPGQTYSIDELFSFINSDNVSLFKTFSYQNFLATDWPYVREYAAKPLSVIHGTKNQQAIAKDGYLRRGAQERNCIGQVQPRNKQYIFFGTLWDHFSRTPACREIDALFRFYGDVVIEFPQAVLSSEANWQLRGNFFKTFGSAVLKDNNGFPVSWDINEPTKDTLPLTEAVRIYCATPKQQLFWREYKAEHNLTANIYLLDEARDIAKQIYNQSRKVVDVFTKENPETMTYLEQQHNKLKQFLLSRCQRIISNSNSETQALMIQFIEQYACVALKDILGQ